MSEKVTGVIKKIKLEGGYGFIKADNGLPDIFFHAQKLGNIRFDDLQEGMKVTVEIEQAEKGLQVVSMELNID